MTSPDRATAFLALHRKGDPLLQPNAFDAGSARLLASLGFAAIATTSSGFAATLGRRDGSVTRDEAVAHCRSMAAAVEIPVSADTENCFADDPDGVAATVEEVAQTGVAGCSVEDYALDAGEVYDAGLARDRVAAAVEAAHRDGSHLVLTARAEGMLHGGELGEVIERLQAFQGAGADVLFAPGLRTREDIAAVVGSVDRPVNVMAGFPGFDVDVATLAQLGVTRVSTGASLARAAYGALMRAAHEMLDHGTFGYTAEAMHGADLNRIFAPPA
jgi:2-methylisocitrate lyase-like PEP mutase family enzyme